MGIPRKCDPIRETMNLSKYLHTVRYFRPGQFGYLIFRRLFPAGMATVAPKTVVPKRFAPKPFPSKYRSWLGGNRFEFLNDARDLGSPPNWGMPEASYTWRYNLHYFDYLNQPEIDRKTCHRLVKDWISGHPPAPGAVGWEAYPLSLRIVNWIKYCLTIGDFPAGLPESLWVQAHNLRRRVEYHVSGNHLFANGKALWFAGVFLNERVFTELGRKIILKESDAQFRPDGGHYELSPMYHALMLEDILDLINLARASGTDAKATGLHGVAGRALGWMETIVGGNGKIPLLNDSVHGIAPSFDLLREYAMRLGIESDTTRIRAGRSEGCEILDLSGYQILSDGPVRLVFDAASLGPDHQPGHAHCDMLAALFDFDGKPVFTDTGVFAYYGTRRRAYARSTPAHNTVVIDGLEQAELWREFRMGRRGYPTDFFMAGRSVGCGHTGFEIWKKDLRHHRTVSLVENGFEIRDEPSGPDRHHFKAYYHLAPDTEVKIPNPGQFAINGRILVKPLGVSMNVCDSEYYPEFGVVQKRPCLVMEGHFTKKTSFGLRCTFCS